MNVNKNLFLGVFVFLCAVSVTIGSVKSETSQSSNVQKDKWAYVQKNLQKQEAELVGFLNKFGSFLNGYAVFFSTPVGMTVAGISSQSIYHKDYVKKIFGDNCTKEEDCFISGIMAAMGGTVVGLSCYGLCKVIGRWLEARPAMCKQVLTRYVAEWSKHKANTPDFLYPLFDGLSVEFAKDVKISNVSEDQALQLIQNILVASMLATV